MSKNASPSEIFQHRLKKARESRGLNQAELGDKAGMPASSIAHFETGTRKPSFESLRRLATALEITTDYLLGRVKDPAGGDIIAVDPEVAVLWRLFHRMSKKAREQAKQLFEIVDAMDKKRRPFRGPKS